MEPKRILLVDDERDFSDLIKVRLESTGKYTVKALYESKNILGELHSFKPELILLDLIMPDIGGLEVCEMLDKDPVGINTPIIVLSCLDKDIDKIRAYKLGIVDYLVKPINSAALLKSVERAIEGKTRA